MALSLVLGTALGTGLGTGLGTSLLAPATADAPAPVVGSRGIGDSYFPLDGNGGIDVQHYDVSNRYDFASGTLRGRTVLTLRATQNLKSFNLDLLLTPTAVSVGGTKAKFRKDGKHELVITPATPLKAGRTVKVVVRHTGVPAKLSYRGKKNFVADKQEVVAVNEPHMAPWWFAANDHPSDKATFTVAVNVPKGKQAISNGVLKSKKVSGKRVTWTWGSKDPMATYLAFFVAGDYTIERGRTDGLPWLNAVSKKLPAKQQKRALKLLRRSVSVIRTLEKDLGPYPYGVTGGVSVGFDLGFALETQTRPVYWPLSGHESDVVVHELAHQWFGDDVSIDRWSDIWLNEGFASFMEYRYAERRGEKAAGNAMLEDYHRWTAASDDLWKVRIGAPGAGKVFDQAVYARGGMAVQALRNRIGEKAFATLLRTWLARHAGGNASVGEFTALAEQVSGQDLGAFFEAWLYAPNRPARTAANGFVVTG